ncbi:N-acetyltransferase [Nocardioidaceae bacterium]|nr:N-acetyltransferase [Nocardioidaceae bacterium]
MSESQQVSVGYDASRQAYVAHLDGREVGHLVAERPDDRGESNPADTGPGVVVMPHTEVDDAAEGHGVGSALAREALDDVRRQGLVVQPVCPFVAGWIERHAAYADLVAG